MKFSKCIILFIITLIFTLSDFNIYATILTPKTQNDLVRESDLIFLGTVSKVTYRLSDKLDESDRPIPFTFVQFKIEKILKGKVKDQKYITLRFTGGWAGEKKCLIIPGIPLFDKGDRDILFVTQNGQRLCPLVGWNQGRYRIFDDFVYNDFGQEVWLSKNEKNTFDLL